MYQIILLVVSIATLNAVVFTMLKKGVSAIDKTAFSLGNIMNLLPQIFFNAYIVGSLALLVLSFLIWLFLLSKTQVSASYPVTIGVNFVLLLIVSRIFLKESLSPLQLTGMAIIIIGAFLVVKGNIG